MSFPPDASLPSRVMVGIPTYHRPDGLAALLDTLRTDLESSVLAQRGRVRVVVVDNGCDPGTADVVRAHDPGVPCEVVPLEEPGYSEIRNVLVAAALDDPEVEWLVWVDDDALVQTPWLDTMVAAGIKYDADLIGGPVLGDLPEGSSRLVRNSLYAGRLRYPTGPVSLLNGNCNIGMPRRLFERFSPPVFDPALAFTGGEDYEFFCRVRAMGGRIIWCDEAVVVEPTPDERLSNWALVQRIRNSNRTSARIDLAYKGVGGTLQTTAKLSWWLVKSVGAGVLRRDPDRFFEAANKVVGILGRAEGLVRHAIGDRYRRLPMPPAE